MGEAVIEIGILRKGEKLIGFSEGTFLTVSADSKFRVIFTDLDDDGLPRVIGSTGIPEGKIEYDVSIASMLSSSMVMFQFEDGTASLIEFSDLDSNFEIKSTTNIITGDNEITIDDGDIKISTF